MKRSIYMDMSIREAAARLGKSVRQVRRMLQNGELPGRKDSGRWTIDSDALPRTLGQQNSDRRLKRNIRAAVEHGLGVGVNHAATDAFTATLDRLIRGCHRYAYEHKAAAYSDAREQACTALRALVTSEVDEAKPIIAATENELLAAIAGLLSRLERLLEEQKHAEAS